MKEYDGVMESIGTVAHNLVFYSEWERIYLGGQPKSPDLTQSQLSALPHFRSALITLYTSILRYQAYSIHYLETGRFWRMSKGTLSGTFRAREIIVLFHPHKTSLSLPASE